jgi:hypothetical protein
MISRITSFYQYEVNYSPFLQEKINHFIARKCAGALIVLKLYILEAISKKFLAQSPLWFLVYAEAQRPFSRLSRHTSICLRDVTHNKE